MKKQNRKQGFTLVELLVVIAILAILATVSIVGYTAFIDRAHKSNAETEAHQVETALLAELLVPNADGENIIDLGAATTDGPRYYITKIGEQFVVATLVTIGEGESQTTEYQAAANVDLTECFKTLNEGDFVDLTEKATFKTDASGNMVYAYNDNTASVTLNLNK